MSSTTPSSGLFPRRLVVGALLGMALLAAAVSTKGNSEASATPMHAATTTAVAPTTSPQTDLGTLGRLDPLGYRHLGAREAIEVLDRFNVVDVREPWELRTAQGALPGVLNIPLQELPGRLDEITSDRPLLLVCRSGNRSGQACAWLQREHGVPCAHVEGGMLAVQRVR